MHRVASVIRLRPDQEAKYRSLHAAVPPGVLSALTEANVRNYSIFLRDGVLFSYLEHVGSDYDGDLARMAQDPATRAWWQRTDPCQMPVATARPGEWWAPADELFHLD